MLLALLGLVMAPQAHTSPAGDDPVVLTLYCRGGAVGSPERHLDRTPSRVEHERRLAGREVPAETRDSVKSNLGLSPGDSVRIKSREEILATLDEEGRCEGLGYMSSEQDRYCGGTYKVLKRVELFFDERTQKMLKVKNTVLLDKVYCEPELHGDPRIAGCQRMCFLFWKEAWLERVDAEAKGDK